MNLILVHDITTDPSRASLLRSALAGEPLGDVVLDALSGGPHWRGKTAGNSRSRAGWAHGQSFCAIPESWARQWPDSDVRSNVIFYNKDVPLGSELRRQAGASRKADAWFTVSNGRFITRIDGALLERVLAGAGADLVAVNAEPALLGTRERMRLTAEGNVAGFRRLYSDSAEFASVSTDWPHHLFIKADVLDRVLAGDSLPLVFADVSRKCQLEGLELRAVDVGGSVLDLETEDGMLSLCSLMLSRGGKAGVNAGDSPLISRDVRLIGKVLVGENVKIGAGAVVIGPAILGNDVKIERGAVISSSIIGSHVCVPENQLVCNCVVDGPQPDWKSFGRGEDADSHRAHDLGIWQTEQRAFRTWPRFSYARCFKRIADFMAALP